MLSIDWDHDDLLSFVIERDDVLPTTDRDHDELLSPVVERDDMLHFYCLLSAAHGRRRRLLSSDSRNHVLRLVDRDHDDLLSLVIERGDMLPNNVLSYRICPTRVLFTSSQREVGGSQGEIDERNTVPRPQARTPPPCQGSYSDLGTPSL